MAYSEAQKKATMKYRKENYERLVLDIKKWSKATYKEQAAKRGMSLQAYIISLIEKDMQQDWLCTVNGIGKDLPRLTRRGFPLLF